jgi:hypothetical protein
LTSGGLRQPPQAVEIGPGLEMPALAAQDQEPHPRIAGERREPLAELGDHLLVVGVVDVRPVEDHGHHAAIVDPAPHDACRHRCRLPIATRRKRVPGGPSGRNRSAAHPLKASRS